MEYNNNTHTHKYTSIEMGSFVQTIRRTFTVHISETSNVPVVTGIPVYEAPPPPPKKRSRFWFRVVLCSVSFFIIFCIIYGFVWLVIQPHNPVFQVDSISIPLGNGSTSDTLQLTTWEFSFHIRNPNKRMKLCYDDMDVSISTWGDYSEQFLAETQVPAFHQGTKNETLVLAKFTYVQQSSVSYLSGKLSDGVVNLKVEMIGAITGKPSPWLVKKNLKVDCSDLKVGFTNTASVLGTLLSGPIKCKSHIVDGD